MNIINKVESISDFIRILQNNKGIVLLKFSAIWCVPCSKLQPIFDECLDKYNIKKNKDITFLDLDVDENF